MSVRITIKNTPIDIPTTGESANWGPAVTEAIQILADAVNTITGTYDVPPQVLIIDPFSNTSRQKIDNLIFPSAQVLSSYIFYSVKRQTQTSGLNIGQDVSEEGTLEIIYHAEAAAGQKWEIIRTYSGNAQIEFFIEDDGQIYFKTDTLPLTGIDHTGIISYRALSILNS